MIVLGCEGPSEVQLVADLLMKGELVFSVNEILDKRPIHFRQPKEIVALINTLPLDEEIVFFRIGDTQNDAYNLTCLSARKSKISIKKVCTKPEIEILVIINEHLYNEYLKVKSTIKPKQFVKSNVNGYVNLDEYIKNHNMIWSIKEYKRIKRNEKDELYLADLLKN